MSNLVELMAAVSAKREELSQQVQAVLKEGIQTFMREQTEIKSLMWNQYTPYFNDGDECLFSVGDIYYSLEKVDLEDAPRWPDDTEEDEPKWFYISRRRESCANLSDEAYQALSALSGALHEAEEDLQLALGDHVKVLINEDGVFIEEFEHD